MRIRFVALVAAVAVVAGAAYWLATPGAQPPAVEPGSVKVTVEASGSGAWSTYTITVRNLGDRPFFGDVYLAGETPVLATGQPVPYRIAGLPQIRTPFLTTGVENLPDDAYGVHLGLAGRHKKTITLQAPAPPLFDKAVVLDTDRNLVDESAVADLRQAVGVGVLTDSDTLPDTLATVRVADLGFKLTVFEPDHPALGGPVGLSGLVAMVIDRYDAAKLPPAEARALSDWVDLGGELVLAGGAELPRAARAVPEELLPLVPTDSRDEPLQPLADLYGASTPVKALTATGKLAPGTRVRLKAADGTPLAVELDHGAGRITELLFDPEAVADAPELEAMAWASALGWQLQRPTSAAPEGVTLMDGGSPDVVPDALLPAPSDAPFPPPVLVFALLLLYLVVVAPVNYLVLREVRRPALFWFTAPAIALVFTVATYAIGQGFQGSIRDHQLHLLRIAPDGAYTDFDVHGVTFPARGAHVVVPAAGSIAAPLTAFHPRTAATCTACPAASGDADVHEHADPGGGYRIDETGVVYGSVRVIGTASAGRLPLALDARLTAGPDGHLRGTIANRGKASVAAVSVFAYFSGAVRGGVVDTELKPGETVAVDVTPTPLADPSVDQPSRLVGLAAAARLVYAAGVQALDDTGSVAIAGLVEPPDDVLSVDGGDVGGVAAAAFGMPVTVAGGNDLLGDYSQVRLAATRAVGSDYANVYDIESPAFTGAAALRYDGALYSHVEVYDWTTGAWRPLTGTPATDAGNALVARLDAGETVAGITRVRVRELSGQQPSWGRLLTVAPIS